MNLNHNLELVTWRDAHFETDEPDEWSDDFLVDTVGWTLQELGGRFLRIVGERTPNGDRAITRVPVGMVVRRTRLAFVEEDE